jgi:soluble lytic murein transglycosylase-like protein
MKPLWNDVVIFSFLCLVCILLAATCASKGFAADKTEVEILLQAMAMQESSCNPNAIGDKESRDKSLGLFQVKLSTARDYDKKLKRKDLFNAKINYKFAKKHIEYLIAHYNGDIILALDAYNRGANKVDHCTHKTKKNYNKKHPYAFEVLQKLLENKTCLLNIM